MSDDSTSSSEDEDDFDTEEKHEEQLHKKVKSDELRIPSKEIKITEDDKQKARDIFNRIIQIKKVSSTELIKKVLSREPLFKKIYTSDSFSDLLPDAKAEEKAGMLVSGFSLKSLQQLREALEAEAILKGKKTEAEMFPCVCSEESSEKSETLPPPMSPEYSLEERMKYLMQLEEYMEVEGELGSLPLPKAEQEERSVVSTEIDTRSPMEVAKKYLKDHKIFQFFQFLVSHLLSVIPEDPIEYLLGLLDRVLLYRAGLISPPLLYEKKHIEQLFHLMDRFGQGYVDVQQYKTAMETLGICSYNKKPTLNPQNMVPKIIFVEEIFNAELTTFNDLIRSRVPCTCDPAAPPPTIVDMDLKAQSSSSEDTISRTIFKAVAPARKFYGKQGMNVPPKFRGKNYKYLDDVDRRDSRASRRKSESY